MKNLIFTTIAFMLLSCSKSTDTSSSVSLNGELSFSANNINYSFIDGPKDEVMIYRTKSSSTGQYDFWVLSARRWATNARSTIAIDIESSSSLTTQTYVRNSPFLVNGRQWSVAGATDTTGVYFTQAFSGDFNNITITRIDNNQFASGTFSGRFTNLQNQNLKIQITNGKFSNVKIVQ